MPLPIWRATMWPARLAALMSIHSTVKPSGSSSARSMSPTALTPAKFSEPLFWLTQLLQHRDGALLLGVDRGDHRLLGAAEPGVGGGGDEKRESGERRRQGKADHAGS